MSQILANSFTKKRIRVEITLGGRRTFAEGGKTIVVAGNPTHVEITKEGIPSINNAKIQIWGLRLDRMKALATVGLAALQFVRNTVEIYAGDVDPLPLVFRGDQSEGVINFDDAGNASISIKAFTSLFAMSTPAAPTSVVGTSPVSVLCEKWATEAGLAFRNEGVSASVIDTIISGDPISKMRKVCEQVGANLIVDDQTAILLPLRTARSLPPGVISPETGMMGYPQVTARGVVIRSLFRPDLQFGQVVEVRSLVPMAEGKHRIIRLTHTLDANRPDGGAWDTSFEAYFNYGL